MKYRLLYRMTRKLRRFSYPLLNRKTHNIELKEPPYLPADRPTKLSTLYVPGRHGVSMYQISKPKIDVSFIERNLSHIEKSCSLRGISLDLDEKLPTFHEWDRLRNKLGKVLNKNNEFLTELKRLKSLRNTSEYEALNKDYTEFIEGTLKVEKEKVHDLEDIILPVVQKIPNFIDPLTPLHSDEYDYILKPSDTNCGPISHLNHGLKCSEIKVLDPISSSYYLSGNFAELELDAQFYFYNELQNAGHHPLSCVDFCKSFIVEAIGLDPYSPDDCIPIKGRNQAGQRLMLVGNASLEAFCAYLTNMNISKSNLPAKYVSLGSRYNAGNRHSKSLDLFSTVQSTNAHVIVLCSVDTITKEFDLLFNTIQSLYLNFRVPFRIVDIAAKNLNVTEARRKTVELWSTFKQEYIPVAHLSQRGDFVSKRLNITYGIEHQIEDYCCLIEGTAVNLPVLIGCLVEHFHHYNQSDDLVNILKRDLPFLYEE